MYSRLNAVGSLNGHLYFNVFITFPFTILSNISKRGLLYS